MELVGWNDLMNLNYEDLDDLNSHLIIYHGDV